MQQEAFTTATGTPVTAVTADEMRAVDRVAVEEVWLSLTRMMEHAGRSLAETVLDRGIGEQGDQVVVLAGAGGNGGGGPVCARHLSNRSISTTVVLDRPLEEPTGVPGEQLAILQRLDGIQISVGGDGGTEHLPDPSLIVDALLGYGLEGAPRGRAATLIEWVETVESDSLALDVPSGVDATTGATPGVAIRPDVTLTLALPKTGLRDSPGEVLLADLSIPPVVYEELDIPYVHPFGTEFIVALSGN